MKYRNTLLRLSFLGWIAAFPYSVLANGPYIGFFNAADYGEAQAGGAALALDATTSYTNSAGLMHLKNEQISFAGIGVIAFTRFDGRMTNPGLGLPTSETGGASSRTAGILPNLYYAKPINDRWAAGISITSPYGLGIKYPSDSLVRYQLIFARDLSLDLGLSLAYRINKQFSIGFGPDIFYFYAKAKLANRTQPLTGQDSIAVTEASQVLPGVHAGILYELTPCTRFGLSYHSQYITHLTGKSWFYPGWGGFLPTNVIRSDNFRLKLPLAAITTLSGYHEVTPKWAIMATAQYYNWGIYKFDHAYNLASPAGPIDVLVERNFHNTLFYALGTSYQYSDKWLLRTGINYTPSATNGKFRDAILSEGHSIGLAAGANYQMTKQISFDVAYSHAFTQTVNIYNTSPITGNVLTGHKTASADALAAQINWSLCC